MATSSAVPPRLERYAHLGLDLDERLSRMSGSLSCTLGILRASQSDFLPPLAPVEDDMQAWVRKAAGLDAWVGEVAEAFLRADEVAFGGVVTSSNATIEAHLALQSARPALAEGPPGLDVGLAALNTISALTWLAQGGRYAPLDELAVAANVADWLGMATTSSYLRHPVVVNAAGKASIVVGLYDTLTGTAKLIERGDPIDAYEEDGAGYLADVADVTFSASMVAFSVAPTPLTAGAVAISGAVWLGATTWDHREEIGQAIDSAWDATVDDLGDVATAVEGVVAASEDALGAAAAAASDLGHTVHDAIDVVLPDWPSWPTF